MIQGSTLSSIANNNYFRIPPYQRGYSWEESHVKTLLVDLENFILSNKDNYYIGVLTVQKTQDYFKDIPSSINNKFYVVDGQQRLTTIYLLLSEILHDPEHKLFDFLGDGNLVDDHIKKFLFKTQFLIFSYLDDNDNYELLRECLSTYDITSLDRKQFITNVYAKNLVKAKETLNKWLKEKKKDEEDYENFIKSLFLAVTEKILFDYKEFSKDEKSDIYVIFETINKRGKPLSDLESLKNRLMYLTTLKPKNESHLDTEETFSSINSTWKKIYQTLGKEINKPLDDDEFLKEHWYMYGRYSREGEKPYSRDLFDLYFTSSNFLNSATPKEFPNKKIDLNEINGFVSTLNKSIDKWFEIKKPEYQYKKDKIKLQKDSFHSYLYKIRQLNIEFFDPIVLSAYYHYSKDELVELTKQMERFIFTLSYITERKSDYGSYDILRQANPLFEDKLLLEQTIAKIKEYVDGNDIKSSQVSIEGFVNRIRDYFVIFDANGYESWKGTKYLLQEYFLKNQEEIDIINLNEYSLVRILNINRNKENKMNEGNRNSLPESFKDLDDASLLNYSFSIGNFVLLSKKRVEKLSSNNSLRFNEIREILKEDFPEAYRELNKEGEYFSRDFIWKRGMKILTFMEERWGILIQNKEKLILP